MIVQPIAVRRANGFTLIELMIVVAIIGILATVAVPSFSRYQNRARRAESFANLSSLGTAQKSYFAEYGLFVGAEITTSVKPTPARVSIFRGRGYLRFETAKRFMTNRSSSSGRTTFSRARIFRSIGN